MKSKKKSDHQKDLKKNESQNNQKLILEIEQQKEKILRLSADLENIRRRTENEKLMGVFLGQEKILMSILPTIDNFWMAMQNLPEEKNDFLKGIENIFEGLLQNLKNSGVEIISETEIFSDPQLHEILGVDPDFSKNKISQVLLPGFKIGQKIIRPAKVRVGGKE